MSVVFDYYHLGITDKTSLLQAVRDKLIDYGWIIDYDEITTNGKLAVHIPNTYCYYTLNRNYDGTVIFPEPYFGIDTNMWYSQIGVDYGIQMEYNKAIGTVYILDSFLLINTTLCAIVCKCYGSLAGINYPFGFITIFGRLNVIEDDNYGNIFYIQPFNCWGSPMGCSHPANDNVTAVCLWNGFTYCYKGIECHINSTKFCVFSSSYYYYSYYPFPKKIDPYSLEYTEGITSEPQLSYQPIQFERIYLRTLPLIASYTDIDGVTYRHIVGETPFYFCKYLGEFYYDFTLEYGARKFKIYANGYRTYESHNFGIAFEVGNL